MKKSLKILFIVAIILFVVFTNKCLAVNIDMNLASNTADSNSVTVSNEVLNTSATSNSTNSLSNSAGNATTQNTQSNSAAVTSSSISSLPESELGLTNILNILLITVGIILIFLAIAILIRQSQNH